MTREEVLDKVHEVLAKCQRYDELARLADQQRLERKALLEDIAQGKAELKRIFKESLSIPCPVCQYPILIFSGTMDTTPYSWQAKCETCGLQTPRRDTLEEVFEILDKWTDTEDTEP